MIIKTKDGGLIMADGIKLRSKGKWDLKKIFAKKYIKLICDKCGAKIKHNIKDEKLAECKKCGYIGIRKKDREVEQIYT